MDPLRFGRALGVGARLAAQTAAQIAAKTAATAVDAALAPNPSSAPVTSSSPPHTTTQAANLRPDPAVGTRYAASQSGSRPSAARPSAARPSPAQSSPARPSPAQSSQARSSQARQAPRRLFQALTGPLRRLSGVLWLEFTGVFFGLFAAAAALGAWRLRAAWRPTPANATNHLHFLLTLAVAALFTYFCASSFLRARRRNRQP